MLVAVADTHAAIWYVFGDRRLSPAGMRVFQDAVVQGDHVGLSSITLAEVVYLTEKQRVSPNTLSCLLAALDLPNSVLIEVPLNRRIVQTLARVDHLQVPDLPDRIIAAAALHLGIPLVRRDARIQALEVATVWQGCSVVVPDSVQTGADKSLHVDTAGGSDSHTLTVSC